MSTGDRVFADPDGKGLRVVEILGVALSDGRWSAAVWDGSHVYNDLEMGENPCLIREQNFDRYPVGQLAGRDSGASRIRQA